jgi:LmbE family N-acetylglucosaminyl deacetylase
MTAPAGPASDGPAPGRRVVFFHAHPDDEAIFTGATIALLAAAGCSVTLVVATSGQLGRRPPPTGDHPTRDDPAGDDVGRLREKETRTACHLLGVERVEFLRYRDSGMPGDPANAHPDAFAHADLDDAARRVADIAAQQHATDLVVYDAAGIYGHPDHIQVHRVGTRAAQLAGTPTLYESTVDRDYLRACPRAHLVSQAHRSVPAHLAPALGVDPGLVSTTVDSSRHLDTKRAAIAAHRSQVLTTSDVITMPPAAFARLYGREWYIRRGPAGTIEHLGHPIRHRLSPAA